MVKVSAPTTSSIPAFFRRRAVARAASMSCMGSRTTTRSMPLAASRSYTSCMVSGWEFCQLMKRKPVPMNCSFVLGMSARVRRNSAHGSSRWVRTSMPIAVLEL